MGLFSKAADSAAAVVACTGQRIAGDKGVTATNKITGPLLGRTFEKTTDVCGNGNTPCVNGSCNH